MVVLLVEFVDDDDDDDDGGGMLILYKVLGIIFRSGKKFIGCVARFSGYDDLGVLGVTVPVVEEDVGKINRDFFCVCCLCCACVEIDDCCCCFEEVDDDDDGTTVTLKNKKKILFQIGMD